MTTLLEHGRIDYGRVFRNAGVMSRNDVMHYTVLLIRHQYFYKYAND